MPLIPSLLKNVFLFQARIRIPKKDGEIHFDGLHAPAEILRDSWNVPHIYAQDLHDLFFAQGFVHAQERMWQMDFYRRMVAGRLSEILGSTSLPLDRWMRILTMRRVAEFETGLLSKEVRENVQAYADGINAFIRQGPLPLEFSLLRYKPEPWIVADTLAWIKMMSWSLSVNWEAEILRSQLISCLGPEMAYELEPPHLKRWPYIVPPGSDYSNIGKTANERAQAARPFAGPSPYEGLGSNNWAISGLRTTSGKPLLASDMHLSLSAPSIWIENHLSTENINAIGVIFPGIPGVIAGHNGSVAWGFTNGFPDVQDLYMERLRRNTDGSVQAEYNGKWENAKVLKESIRIKGRDPIIEEVIITRHGPIINALAPDFTGEQPLALRWTSLEPDTMIEGVLKMLTARNCQEFHQALRTWTSPTQNTVYADTSGNIAYTFAGKIPIRVKGDGRIPVPGWNDEYEWSGYIPFEDLPHLDNPPQGYIVTANNQTISDDYPIRIDLEPISGDRAQRIAEMILENKLREGEEKIDIPFVQKMHYDQLSPTARIIARYIGQIEQDRSAKHLQTDLDKAILMFKDWDGTLSADSPTAAVYELFIRKMIRLMLSDKLKAPSGATPDEQTDPRSPENEPVHLIDRFMGKGPTPVLADIGLFADRWISWLSLQMENPISHWFDLGNGENRDDIIRLALQASIDDLKRSQGPETKNWAWGKMHKLTLNHPLASGGKFLEALFNRGPYPIGGDHTTIWATGSNYHDLETEKMVGPPYRFIADLNDLGNSVSMLLPGQCGNPASKHYDDQITSWFKQEYHPMFFTRQDVKTNADYKLKLIPK